MPLAWVIGGGILSGVLGGVSQSSQNNQAKDAARGQNEYNNKVYEFQYGSHNNGELGC